ncbi:fructosamine-3-kinase [Branchiibius hedensis]|uniref:Fructosamine-3-kinase n=1 Tax=Branchiibius hedensis TaxID=672460 RepID=A0A2Y8ZPQ5_9MICO|nr:fructosamine kinase family protein [Branchiibius hedensis]PWJ25100.1 fructosamine-3-kinase [Branchiibius hedensis]SSA33915.1 Fructosamine-3-kinase [Branchiibius hedensis]
MGARPVTLSDGRRGFAKEAPQSAITAEAASLEWLRVPDGPPLPTVLSHDPQRLVTAYVESSRPDPQVAEDFGRRLAAMHSAGAAGFGAAPPGGPELAWFGATRMLNKPVPQEDWATWYARDRVAAYVRQAVDAGSLTLGESAVFDEVCERLPQLAGPAEAPARLHGDLWSGNVLWSHDGAWLIDPAAHGGHRESDLALLALFGCPHLERIRSAYDEVSPLAPGWRGRVPLHQLFPLLAHVVIFGRGYAGQALDAARSALDIG